MPDQSPDAIDRLYERLTLASLPANFTARVMARARAARRAQVLSAVVSAACLVLVGGFAFALGRGLTLSGMLDYLRLLFDNLDVAPEFAADFAAALLDALPWVELGALAAGVAAIWFASALLPRLLANLRARGD